MEPLPQLSTDSFSLSWMTNLNTSSHICSRSYSFDSFIEMDLGFNSMRWKDFDFGVPDSQDTDLVQADDIFANGIMLPLRLESKVEPEFSDSNLSRALSVHSSQKFPDIFAKGIKLPLRLQSEVVPEFSDSILSRASSVHSSQMFPAKEHLSKSRPMFCTLLCCPYRDTKQNLRKYFRSLRKKLQKYWFFLVPLYKKVKGLRMNPSKSPAVMSTEWCCSSSSVDNRIYDAILHCKKSIVS